MGNSWLINNILFKGKKEAKEGDYNYTTMKRYIYEKEKTTISKISRYKRNRNKW